MAISAKGILISAIFIIPFLQFINAYSGISGKIDPEKYSIKKWGSK
jgi:hypothetical protein